MNRRDFLKIGILVSANLLVPLNASGSLASPLLEIRLGDQLYRGTADGRIYMSEDAGQTWTLHTSFGPGLSIQHLCVNRCGQLQARLGMDNHSFELALAKEDRIWRTV